jgi:ribulose-phosphate 3-epimerase
MLDRVGWNDWIRGAEVEPSLYGADFSRLGEQIEALLAAGCRIFHLDVGDGHFVEPVTMGPIVLQSISPIVHAGGGALDVHLMVERPAKYFESVAKAGGDSVTFHFEAVEDVPGTVADARAQGLQAGVAFNPESEPEAVARVAGDADLVLCMAIHPGYSGQPFRRETFERIVRLREALPSSIHIQVDGGVGSQNIRELRDRGASLLVAASSIFARDDPPAAYRELAAAVLR